MVTKRAVAMSILLLAGVLLSAPGAFAITWATRATPALAYEDGIVQARGYGNYFNYQSLRAQDSSYQWDSKPGGNGVTVKTHFYWHGPQASCGGVCWWFDLKKDSAQSYTASWVAHYRARNLRGDADQTRGQMEVCEVQSFQDDPCSSLYTATFSY